ncbi:MAG: Fe-S cluster assembly protein SufD [Acaryochloridaceae cyanobacterium RU_4_10]|nr:Fe-S cluster assembly protein SufD [Acaryochloridaceae cyanobacterium RU_4_10]
MSLQVTNLEAELKEPQSLVSERDRAQYLAQLIEHRNPLVVSGWLGTVRDRALNLLRDQALPSTRDEDWRFTDLSALYRTTFQPVKPAIVTSTDLDTWTTSDLPIRIVVINGVFAPEHSTLDTLPSGITVQSLATAEEAIQPYLLQQQGMNEVFTALNTASFTDGVVIRVGKNQVIETPIHLLFLTVAGDVPVAIAPRALIIAESGSAATLIEEYGAIASSSRAMTHQESGEGTYWTNAVTEISLADNAQLHHTRTQREATAGFHIGKTAVAQSRDSRYSLTTLNIGAQISRHNPEIVLTGIQTETHLNGLTLAVQSQLSDTHSLIHFAQPHCIAKQLNKCIVNDRARAVFNGRIEVPKAAQQTNAAQLSRNLLLSSKARVDTKPQLEIVADDVKCAHGATVSQLEDEEIFYLQSRGLDRESACDLLVKGFAAEITEKVPSEKLRSQLLTSILSLIRD